MGWTIVVSGKFVAAHRLVDYPGNCVNVHGHTWKLEIAVKVDKLDNLGIGVDFRLLKGALNRILNEFDHTVLVKEGDTVFRGIECVKMVEFPYNPTAEVIAVVVYSRMKGEGWNVEWVRVWESETTYVEYRGEDQ
jgi:6-pyruvoyltetrahydropterin/6-carboxytetrahydropterin synthase